ncbi:MAG: two-component sensor histidine kinase [Kordiimonas sp.]|nr:two-component sensor histidine kinase [Kordiimonas sp.]|tara:strand:- start:5084 stop:6184 length:1101 start_codon:yes stop_codon:yes gene_type:complete
MGDTVRHSHHSHHVPGHDAILNSLGDSILLVGPDNRIVYVNSAGENFFAAGAGILSRQKINELVPYDSPLLALIDQARTRGIRIAEYDVDIGNPKVSRKTVDIHVGPLVDEPDFLLLQLQEQGIAHKIDQQLTHRGAARLVTSMAAVLAHEIKNPLSGIRGSAQLLEHDATDDERELTQLICEETDRICALVDSMETFSSNQPLSVEPVNVHSVLEHVRKLAENGFASKIKFHEYYDPSIPNTLGDRSQLIQVFLNLVKNAAEAVPEEGGDITLTTAYRHGVRFALPGSKERVHLPLEVCVIDNGSGVPEDLKEHLFDPFVTTKAQGKGLGLALVAKIIGDHGGVIECESVPKRTVFRVLLPSELG